MKKNLTYRIALLAILLLSLFLYLIYSKVHSASNPVGSISTPDNPAVTVVPPDHADNAKDNHQPRPAATIMPKVTPTPVEPSIDGDLTLNVRGVSISLGDTADSVIEKLGQPGRIDDTEYNFDYYIYNNNYQELVFIAVKGRKVVGFYTDSLDFDFYGITSGCKVSTVNQVLKDSFSLNSVLVHKADTAVIRILVDQLRTKKVTGIYVLDKTIKKKGYDKTVKLNEEQLSYDLVNSARARNDIPVLSYSSSAALAAQKHSKDMARNGFFGHTNLKWQTPGDRLINESIAYTKVGENIGGGFNSVILACHAWYNSSNHRKNILSEKYRYLGAGFSYAAKSQYKTYLTQVYYR